MTASSNVHGMLNQLLLSIVTLVPRFAALDSIGRGLRPAITSAAATTGAAPASTFPCPRLHSMAYGLHTKPRFCCVHDCVSRRCSVQATGELSHPAREIRLVWHVLTVYKGKNAVVELVH